MATQKKFVVKNGLIASGLTYPTADGTANQTIVTDGAGNLTFERTSISETVQMLVKNVSGGSLAKGTPIHQTGTAGQHSEVIAARADTAGAMPSVGVLAETLADDAEGYAVITGRLSNIDTSSYSEGDVLFVGATGGLTATKPTGESNVTQNIGIVNKSHASAGSITIYGSGRGAATPNLDDGNIFIGNSSNQSTTTTLNTSIVPESGNLYYTDARVGTYISGNRTYGNITTTGYIAGPATLTIDPAGVGDNTGTVVIAGNFQVDGTQTTVNSTTMDVDDLNITVASGAGNAAAANGAGLTVDGASATLTYAATGDKWVFNKAPHYNTDRLLTTADEGTGNSLDADTVDGKHFDDIISEATALAIALG